MSKLLVLANEATAAQRRVYFHLVDATDGITAETGEAGGQPQVSSDGGAWTNTGIGTLSAIGSGRYYADLTQTLVATAGTQIETRYKSANTAECPGDSVQVVAFDPNDTVRLGLTALPNAAADAAGGLPISDAGGLDLDAKIGALTFTVAGDVDVNVQTWGGTAIATPPAVNATQISGDSGAADNAEAFFDGTGYAGTNNVIPTVTTVTNLHASAATAAELAKVPKSDSNVTWNATAAAQIQSEAADALTAYAPPTYTQLLNFIRVMCRKDAAIATDLLSVLNTINADLASGAGAFANTTDSGEAIRDNMGTAQTGDSYARLGAPSGASIAADIAARASQTSVDTIDDFLDTEVADILAAVDTEIAAIKAKTDQLTFTSTNKVDATLQAAADIATAVVQKIAHVVLRRTMANVEAASDGDTLDLSSLYGAVQLLQEASISGSILTVKKTDGITTLGTKTLTTDAAADPITAIS